MPPGKAKSVGALIDAAVHGELNRAQAWRLCKDHPEVIIPGLPAAAKRIAEQDARITELEGDGLLRNGSAPRRVFAKKLRRLLRDGMRWRKRPDFAPG